MLAIASCSRPPEAADTHPAQRTAEQLRGDVADGKVSREAAASYGVTHSLTRLRSYESRERHPSLQAYYDDGRS